MPWITLPYRIIIPHIWSRNPVSFNVFDHVVSPAVVTHGISASQVMNITILTNWRLDIQFVAFSSPSYLLFSVMWVFNRTLDGKWNSRRQNLDKFAVLLASLTIFSILVNWKRDSLYSSFPSYSGLDFSSLHVYTFLYLPPLIHCVGNYKVAHPYSNYSWDWT